MLVNQLKPSRVSSAQIQIPLLFLYRNDSLKWIRNVDSGHVADQRPDGVNDRVLSRRGNDGQCEPHGDEDHCSFRHRLLRFVSTRPAISHSAAPRRSSVPHVGSAKASETENLRGAGFLFGE
jgi:hypothetical protein